MPMANLCRIFVLKKYGGAFRKGTHGNTLFTCRTNRKASEKDSAPGNLIPVSTAFLLYPKKPFSGEERISTPLPVWKGSTITEISQICIFPGCSTIPENRPSPRNGFGPSATNFTAKKALMAKAMGKKKIRASWVHGM